MLEALYALGAMICALIMMLIYAFVGRPGFTGGAADAPPLTPLQKQIGKEYKDLATPTKHPSFEEFCYPKEYKVQRQQEFVAEYMEPASKPKEMLVYHSIGAGKTCLAIQTALKWIKRGKPLILMPASLIPGFYNEFRSTCGGYMTEKELTHLRSLDPATAEYKQLIAESNAKIDKDFQIMSYNKFLNAKNVEAPLIIVDEVQNLSGMGSTYRAIHEWIAQNEKSSVLIMSATPIFDSTKEIYALAKLLRIDSTYISPDNIPRLFAGKVSYYAGAPAHTVPQVFIKVKKCQMSKHQARWYKAEVEAEQSKMGNIKLNEISNDFYIKSRQKSNVVYPHGLGGKTGMDSLGAQQIRDSLDTYSCKYDRLIRKLKRGGLAFVYTSFTGAGGIAFLCKCLEAFGWQNYATEGVGPKRYAIWSGDQTMNEKDAIRQIFNNPNNDHGGKIQIIIGSPSIKEGVSLMRVRQVHILESYWNHSRLEQIYGRAVRYCSHKSLDKKDRFVKIYIYAAIADDNPKPDPMSSIDLYMLDIANRKRDETVLITDSLTHVAVDRALFQKD